MFIEDLTWALESAGCRRDFVGLKASFGIGVGGGGGGGGVGGCGFGGGIGREVTSPGVTSLPGISTSRVAAMLYYSLDPQFSALIFSLYGRHERFTLIPDALACYAHGPPNTSDILAYAHAFGLQLYALGDHYACLLTQVRAGSVIFLVGVGSLVCWKLWEHWRKGGSSSATPTPTPTTSPKSRRPRGILASLLEEDLVQDLEDFEDEDPAFIQGRYFGPDSPCNETPCEDLSLVSTVSEFSNSEVRAQDYHADASNSYSAADAVSSSEDNSLPTDEDSDAELLGSNNRIVKRKHRASELHRNQGQGTPSKIPPNKNGHQMTAAQPNGSRKHKIENRLSSNSTSAVNQPQDGWLSSESSPGHKASCPPCPGPWRDLTRHQGDGSETPDSEDIVEKKRRLFRTSPPRHYMGVENENSWYNDSRLQPEGEERFSGATNTSLSDLMERMRQRHRGSISRDNSIASNMSDILLSPSGTRRLTFKREDSICSNISDFAPSECSEMSLDVSLKEDFCHQTFTCLDDIEHELDDLKSSMIEMDEEVTKFTSKPNPYMLKTTFSDYSITSGDSRPGSALDILNSHRSRANMKGLLGSKANASSESEVLEGAAVNPSQTSSQVVSEAEGSFEWDSPQHGWSSMKYPPLSKLPEQPSEDAESSRTSMQDDMMPSLEWDNDCLRQYAEEEPAASHEDPNDEVFHPNSHDRQQLLPDHSSLELDLEEELLSPTATSADTTDLRTAPMTISVDSAIHSATGSRSTSSSPLPSALNQSLLSSSGLASSCEISPTTPDSESAGWSSWDRRLGPGEFGSKARRYWSSEESGFMESLDAPLDTTLLAHLSPVHEIKEKETSESSASTPRRLIDNQELTLTEDNINENTNKNLNNNLNMGNKSSTCITGDNDNSQNSSALTNSKTIMAIGQKIKITEYAETEWHGNTPKAQTIRQGYSAIPVELNLKHLRRVRGDNYCGVRAALYQMLSLGLPLPSGHATHTRLASELKQGSSWLQDWSFANRLEFSKEQILNGFWECLDALDNIALNLAGCENRECVVLSRLNGDPTLDIKLCEAVKLHMLAAALDLHVGNNNGDNVPLFAMIMFARHSSLTPQDLLRNHLNAVGDTAGLEQIEMFLMGYTLRVTLQVVRPASYGKDDFICYYPDANIGIWPEVTLVAEDDRHYNVLVK